MKTKKEEVTARSAHKRYTAQFKEQALERADRDGIPRVSQDLGLAEATLYAWRAKRRQTGQPFEDQSSNKLNWLALNGTTPAWKRKWLS